MTMNQIVFRKLIRRWATKLGVLRPLRAFVFYVRGYDQPSHDRNFYGKYVRPGDLVFDVGANRGQSSEIFLALGAKVVAFEPQADMHDEIRQVCRHSSNLTIEACGLGARAETRRFFITAYDQVASLREDWEGVRIGETRVEIRTLDEKIAQYGMPDYCKIDVEGWEMEVLEGLSQPIPLLSFEYHLSRNEAQAAHKVLERLEIIGPYYCNLKEASQSDFALADFIPIAELRTRFPHDLGVRFQGGYGDIFCTLDPQSTH